jgi:hypothetical protein
VTDARPPAAPRASANAIADASMHDMLRMMDVASALRRERELAESQLELDEAKARLRGRLLATAAAAGETVTPAEVDAAIAQYFARQHRYEDPPPSWRRLRAQAWVMRKPLAVAGLLLAIALFVVWALATAMSPAPPAGLPQPAPRTEAPAVTPTPAPTSAPALAPKPAREPGEAVAAAWQAFSAAHDELVAIAADADARQRIEAIAGRARTAHAANRLGDLQTAARSLAQLGERLRETWTVRIVSRSGEDTGVERTNAGRTSGLYLIVEAVDANGNVLPRSMRNAEDGRTETVRKWGEQIPEAIWDRVVADKQADGIVDDAEFAKKEVGRYDEVVVFADANGKPLRRGRQITRW